MLCWTFIYDFVIFGTFQHDFKEIGSGEGNINEGNIVLQVQKVRNVSAPKHNEESGAAPRLLKLSLTDGKNNYQAVEFQHIPSLR